MFFILYRVGKFLAVHMPLKAGYRLAGAVSSIYCFFSKNDRYAVKSNLKVLFPSYEDRRIDTMVKKVFINFGKYLVDFFRFSKIDKDYMDRYVKVEGVENLTDALKEKKGVIMVSAHLGNWELGGVAISALGFPCVVVALDHKDSNVNRFFIGQRQMKGVGVIPVGVSLRRCFSVLGENKLLALVSDRDYFDNGLEIDFFGRPTIIPKGAAVFSRRCGSPLVPVFMIRNEDDTFTLRIDEPIRFETSKDEHRDIVEITNKIARTLEAVIREYPTQWYVFREFWERIGWERKTL